MKTMSEEQWAEKLSQLGAIGRYQDPEGGVQLRQELLNRWHHRLVSCIPVLPPAFRFMLCSPKTRVSPYQCLPLARADPGVFLDRPKARDALQSAPQVADQTPSAADPSWSMSGSDVRMKGV